MAYSKDDNPGTPGLAYLAQLDALELCRDLYGGTFAMRKAGEKYMPRFEAETREDYAARVAEAVLHNAYRRSVRGLTGMVFRKEPVLSEDVPSEIEADWENIDLAGRHGRVFARDAFEDKMIAGHVGIFVDWSGPEGARSRAEEEDGEARPYWAMIRKDQIIRFRTEKRSGQTVLVSFAYLEDDRKQTGEFAEKAIFRVRQYDLEDGGRVLYRSWTKEDAEKAEWEVEEAGKHLGERMDEIPLAVDYGDRTGFLTSNPPLEDLAHLNRRHWSLTSDRDSLIHTSHAPVFTVIGESESKLARLKIGANTGLVLESPDADAKYVEASGSALEQSGVEVDKLEKRMAQHGLSMLESDTRAAETAASKRIDKVESDSQLAGQASNTQDALEEAVRLHAKWRGLESGGSIEINKDYEDQPIPPELIGFLDELVKGRNLSRETLWRILLKRGVLPEDFDEELERERIESDPGDQLQAVRNVVRREQAQEAPNDEEDLAA